MAWVGLSDGAGAYVTGAAVDRLGISSARTRYVEPYLACDACNGHYPNGRIGMPCVFQVREVIGSYAGGPTRKVQCCGTVIDVGAEIAKIVPTYDPAWWIVTTGDNVIRPRWETPLR